MIEATNPSSKTVYETIALLLTEGITEDDYLAPIKKAESFQELTPIIIKRVALVLQAFHKNLPLYFTVHRVTLLLSYNGTLRTADKATPYYSYLEEIDSILNEWYSILEQQL